jgi:hypothetical protein
MPRERRTWLLLIGSVVAVLFVAGLVLHPKASESPNEDAQIAARQRGYYLCLNRRPMDAAQMYRLIKRRLPKENLALAMRGCQEAQKPSGD